MARGDRLVLSTPTGRRMTAADLVRDSLRTAILRGDLPGDTRLVQTEIAAQLQVSTTPVREAMRDLVTEGLIVMDSHKIGRVRKPEWQDMAEIVEVRRALEPLAVRLSMESITAEELAEARDLADTLASDEELGPWVQDNIRFHSIFHRATRTTRLSGILVSLEEGGGVFVAQAQRLHPETRKRAVADHYALLDAYDARDEEKAVAIQLEHITLPLQAFHLDADRAGSASTS